jgi:signal transduction histidine kinase/ligand-binding sensor domain-containing protein
LNRILSIVAFAFTYLYGYGQPYYFKHYQVENGLSNNTVYASIQDDKGFMWFGTKDGLNRFDGYTFKTYRNDPKDPKSIGNNLVFSLDNSHGNLLAGTGDGVFRYDPAQENFKRLNHTKGIRAFNLQTDQQGNIWIIAANGLYKLQEGGDTIRKFSNTATVEYTFVYPAGDGSTWIGASDGFIRRYNYQTEKIDIVQNLNTTGIREATPISAMRRTNDGKLLVGTTTQGLKLFDPNTGEVKDLISLNGDKTNVYVRDILRNTDQEYWIATESGVYIYDHHTGKNIHLEKQNSNKYSVADNAVYTLCRDNQGGIWLGSYFGGISYYSAQYSIFSKHFPLQQDNAISGNAVREIQKDQYGRLWIGTEDAGLNKYDISTGLFSNYRPDGTKTSIVYSNIHGLMADGNRLWIGTFHHGIDIMDVRTGKVIKHYNAGSRGLTSDFVMAFFKTRKGQILVASTNGLFQYRSSDDYFERFEEMPRISYSSVLEASDGTIWIGSFDEGLFRMKPDGTLLQQYRHEGDYPGGMSNNTVTSIFEDAFKNIWITTEGGGLLQYKKDNNTFSRYTVKNGFPTNFLFRIEEDQDHTFWISSSRGLINFNPQTQYVKTYTKSDGLLTNQFNYSSSYKDGDGRIYFGSLKGLISFDPQALKNKVFDPAIFITNFHVQHTGENENQESYPFNQSIISSQEIRLQYHQSSFNIDVAALSYFAPEMTEYAYRMIGLYDDWERLKSNRKIYFTKLEPGTYTFQVRALVHGSTQWSKNEASLKIIILPPIWKSNWAYFCYAAIAVVTIFLLIRYFDQRLKLKNQIRRKIFENEKEKEIYQAKIEFFTMVSHEIRTPLTLIKGPMEKLLKQAQEVPSMEKNLNIMNRNTERLLSLTNQLLDFRKTEISGYSLNYVRANIPEIIREVVQNFEGIAEHKHITLRLRLHAEPFYAYIDMEAFYKIIFSLLDNAFKYGKSMVAVTLDGQAGTDHYFRIVVKSDGAIIPAAAAEKIFEPFYRVKESKSLPGTGIGLSISRALTELHQGTLVLDQHNTTYNAFILKLPVHHSIEFNLQEKWKKHLPSTPISSNETSDQPF